MPRIIRASYKARTKSQKRIKRASRKSRLRAKFSKPSKYIENFQEYLNDKGYNSEMWFMYYLYREPTIMDPERNKPLLNKKYYVDIIFEPIKVIIEVDGGYHQTRKQRNLDTLRDTELKSLGYMVYRIEHRDNKKAKEVIQILRDLCWEYKKNQTNISTETSLNN